jgi:hypothetical protein
MKVKTQKLLIQVEELHDWTKEQAWQWEACGVVNTATCRACGMLWKSYRNGQNSGDSDEFTSLDGRSVSLIDAAVHCV